MRTTIRTSIVTGLFAGRLWEDPGTRVGQTRRREEPGRLRYITVIDVMEELSVQYLGRESHVRCQDGRTRGSVEIRLSAVRVTLELSTMERKTERRRGSPEVKGATCRL